ncbi:uncharacterized protein LOC132196197 isoform X2 [Neocloeon triangulifer]|uniref:uncharacterized protein LOC132196197 isoform X2 n=1 Tax=Neocloeon triangulifer TaxID=2078957 RepID=UPI00286EDBD9|nr:uncharacterized protein LOC132196197 isoform X2 [Neocloeon triangulifer]
MFLGRRAACFILGKQGMQNLSISCALVCLIILGSSALVGLLGVVKHQISAVLITGVMYLLAATFAMFSLVIMHFKRQSKKGCGLPEVVRYVAPEYYTARVFSNGWSLEVGWLGVVLCVLTSGLWFLLSKIMRYNPLVSLISS